MITALAVLSIGVRLVFDDAQLAKANQTAHTDPEAKKFYDELINNQGPALLNKPPEGKPGLNPGRRAVKNTYLLGAILRLTGDTRYATRLEQELVALAGVDWFAKGDGGGGWLAWSEFSNAVSVGFDWAGSALSADAKAKVVSALQSRGLDKIASEYKESAGEKWAVNTGNCAQGGYNGVCVMNGAALLLALALHDAGPAADVALVQVPVSALDAASAIIEGSDS